MSTCTFLYYNWSVWQVVKDDQPKEELEEGEAPESPEEGEAVDDGGVEEESQMEVEKDQRKVKGNTVVICKRLSGAGGP